MNRSLLLMFPFSLTATCLYAQAEKTADEKVIVTATRNPLPLSKLGASVIVIDRADIESSGATSVAELIQGLPGFVIRRTGGAGSNTEILIRGDKGGHTLVMIDGIEQADVTTIEKNYDIGAMPLSEVERIEIVKGPHSVANGASGLSGVIHIITRHSQKGMSASVGIEAGSFDTYGARAHAAGQQSDWGYEARVSGSRTSGYASTGSRSTEADGFERKDGQLRIMYGGSGPYIAELSLRSRLSVTDLDAGANSDDPNFQLKSEESSAQLSQKLVHNDFSQTRLVLALSQTDRRFLDDPDAGNPERDQTWSRGRYQGERQSLELSEVLTLANEHSLLFSAQWVNDRAEIKNLANYQGFEVNEYLPEQKVSESSYSVQYQWNAYDRLSGQFGGRTLVNSQFGSKTVGQAALNFTAIPDWTTVRLNFGRGFKTPSIYQLRAPTYGNQELRPESVVSGEVALDQTLGGGLSASISGFQNRTENLIGFDSATSRYFNVNRALIKGKESRLIWEASGTLRMQAHYTSLTTLDEQSNQPLPSRPDDTWGGDLQWKPNAFSLYLAIRGQSQSRAQPYVDGTEGFRVLDTAFGWQSGPVRTSLRINNALNTSYNEVAGYNTPLRNLLGSLDYSL